MIALQITDVAATPAMRRKARAMKVTGLVTCIVKVLVL